MQPYIQCSSAIFGNKRMCVHKALKIAERMSKT